MEKVVSLVTGASSGLGREIARLLCFNGHVVYVTARRASLLNELKKSCSKESGKIVVVSGDLADGDFRVKLILGILRKEGRIDYLVNNAGFGKSTKFEDMKDSHISAMIEVNIGAYAHLTKLVLPSMKKRRSGRIIHLGSVVAFTPLPFFTLYDATKAAVYSFNRALRYELKGTGVTSTVVLPARMKTGFADHAYNCHKENGKIVCATEFNKTAGDPDIVARKIVEKIDSGVEVITPTFKAGLWYTMRYFGFIVDFVMKNILGPKELKRLEDEDNSRLR